MKRKTKQEWLLSIRLMSVLLFLAIGLWTLIAPEAARADDEIFSVNSSLDDPDQTVGDCVCLTASGHCTLRAAIQEANSCSGDQTIRFDYPMLIQPATALPEIIADGTLIDGRDQWKVYGGYEYPGVKLDGNGATFDGLVIRASYTGIYGLQIVNFGHGVYVHDGAQNNIIGGTGTHQRNIISRNGQHGVRIEGATSTGNQVVGNYIGTNPGGVADSWGGISDWGNGWHGVSVWNGANNRVANNLVADNGWSGVTMDFVSGVIRENRIGMDINGQPLGNAFFGIHIANGAWPSVSHNDIAFNLRGIHVDGGSDPWIYHNTIYSNTASMLTPPDGGGILVTGSGTHSLINYNEIYSNTACYGGGIAVEDGASPAIHYNTIQANRAYTTGNVSLGGGGIYVDQASAGIEHNQVLSNTAAGEPSATVFPCGGGIYLYYVTSATVYDNEIRGNVVDGNAGGGGGISVVGGDGVQIRHNTIVGNDAYTWSYSGGGVDVNSHSAADKVVIDSNWISTNDTRYGGSVLIGFSSHISVTNNIIAHNATDGLCINDSTTDIVATNNTIARNAGDGITMKDARLELYNTIVVSNTYYGVEVTGVWTLSQTRNDIWGNLLGNSNEDIFVYMQEDPLFFDASADIYALRPGSPCIDDGDPVNGSPTSYNGLPRPQGDGYDLGAYEMSPPTFLPLVLQNS